MDTIILRRYRNSGDVLAVLPECEANPGYVVCYQHVGQHGEGDWSVILQITRPCSAADPDAAALLTELASIGYRPRIRRRMRRP